MDNYSEIRIYRSGKNRLSYCQYHVHSLFDELIHKAWGMEGYRPSADVFESEDEFMIYIDLPGVEEGEIKVTAKDDLVVVEGRRGEREFEEEIYAHHVERAKGYFRREFKFYSPIDTGNIRKELERGVLTLIINRRQKDNE